MLSVHSCLSVLVLVTGPWTCALDLGSSSFASLLMEHVTSVEFLSHWSLTLGPVVVEADAGVQAGCEESMES